MGKRRRAKGRKFHGNCKICGAKGTYWELIGEICINCAHAKHLKLIKRG